METRTYQAPRGFTIIAITIRCNECGETMPPESSYIHRQFERLEESKKQGSGTRQCMCNPGSLDPRCPRHGRYSRR